MKPLHILRAASLAAAVALSTGACATLGLEPRNAGDPAARGEDAAAEMPPIRRDLKYVVVDVDANELRFMDGDVVLWRAPVGTGTGFRLATDDRDWEFTTPSGTMYVQRKEMNPTWILPDWWFVENRRRVPPADSPERRVEGGLGAAAIYLGDEIAIHGTDRPELLGQRVSHGCIRLSNENAIRLFHNVQVGTPVMIVGKQEVLGEQPDSVAAFTSATRRAARPPNPLARVATATLLTRLDRALAAPDTSAAWVAIASTLLERGIRDDAPALRGILSRAGTASTAARDREYATFVADAFSRGPLRATVSLNRIAADARDRAAEAIVRATMDQWHGALDARTSPWPTNRVPTDRLGPEGQAGWRAIQAAEEAYRLAYSRGRPVHTRAR
jgi:hypothetical protein